jgi:trigger factor
VKVLNNFIENREALITVELEPAEVEKSLKKSYEKIVKRTEVPGFRKGKAPRSVLEKHIGEDKLMEDALNSLIPETYENAIKEQNITPIAEPSIILTKKEPVTFEAKIPLPPIVRIGDYRKIKIKPEKVKIKEEEVNKLLEELRHRSANYRPVERAARIKDLITIDIDGVVGEENIIEKKAISYHIVSGVTYPAPGFPEKLLKMKRDEEKEFSLKLSKNYHKKELAEKEALFKVKITEIKEEVLPEINDDFARSLGPDVKNLEGLKKEIKNNLKSSAEGKAMAAFEDKVIEALIEKSELEYPAVMVDREVNNMLSQYLQQLSMSVKSRDEYENILKTMPKDEMIDRYKPLAIKRIESSLVLEKVSEAEKIEVSDAEIDSEIEQMIQNTGDKKDEQKKYLNTPQNKDYIKRGINVRKTVQKLLDIARNTKKKTAKQEETK